MICEHKFQLLTQTINNEVPETQDLFECLRCGFRKLRITNPRLTEEKVIKESQFLWWIDEMK